MSQWTHVAIIIRFDGLAMLESDPNNKITPNLGNTCDFDSDDESWDKCDVPKGSEGSLQHTLWTNPHKSHMARYVATIWGDLRDYDSTQEIIDYVIRVTSGKTIRNLAGTIDVEGQKITMLGWGNDELITLSLEDEL